VSFFLATLTLLKLQALLSVTAIVMLISHRFVVASLKAKSWQFLNRVALLMAIVAPFLSLAVASAVAPPNFFKPALQIGAEVSKANLRARQLKTVVAVLPNSANTELSAEAPVLQIFSIVVIALLLVQIAHRASRYARDRRKLRKLISTAHAFKEIGKTRLLVSRNITVPLAARVKRKAIVVVPEHLLADAENLKLVVRHELQHHRQFDFQWNLLLESAHHIAGWNPLIRLWLDRIEESDELACDEALLGRQSVEPTAYATCLYQVARAALTTGGEARLAGTAGMAAAPNFLKRRIEMVFHKRNESRLLKNGFLALMLVGLCTTAWSAENLVKDRRISERAAEQLARKTQAKSGIPIVMNKRVLYWLNQATGSSRTRFFMRNTLKRMQSHRPLIAAKLQAAGVPEELLAVPIIETGYQNTQEVVAAGIWSFVPQTAKRYGLRVDDELDERLDVAKETDAAIAYLTDNKNLFAGDWHLALLSYTLGENTVQKMVAKAGYRDVFRLADEGFIKAGDGDNYVPKFIAAVIIMNNPELVKE
jgi:membrane-bound lytic murein transglycosylase D